MSRAATNDRQIDRQILWEAVAREPLSAWEQGATTEQLSHWNSGDVAFVRCDSFLSQCKPAALRQKMRFLDAQGNRIKVTYTYPIYRWALSAWQEEQEGEWYEIVPAEGQFLYALERGQVKDFVELGLPEAPHLIAFDGSQVIALYNRQRRHEWDEYLDFDMAWEAVISDVPLAEIRAESVHEIF